MNLLSTQGHYLIWPGLQMTGELLFELCSTWHNRLFCLIAQETVYLHRLFYPVEDICLPCFVCVRVHVVYNIWEFRCRIGVLRVSWRLAVEYCSYYWNMWLNICFLSLGCRTNFSVSRFISRERRNHGAWFFWWHSEKICRGWETEAARWSEASRRFWLVWTLMEPTWCLKNSNHCSTTRSSSCIAKGLKCFENIGICFLQQGYMEEKWKAIYARKKIRHLFSSILWRVFFLVCVWKH